MSANNFFCKLFKKINRRLNKNGQAYGLTVLAPIKKGRAGLLRNALASIPPVDAESPMASIPLTHNARFNIIDELPFVGSPALYDHLENQYLLFSCAFDTGNTKSSSIEQDLDAYLAQMYNAMSAEIKAIWGQCIGFPEELTVPSFQEFVRKYQISGGLFFADYPNNTAEEVRRALFEQKKFIDFAIKSQELAASNPAKLKAEFYSFYEALEKMPTPPPGSILK